ncbi:uncharacterized protein LOC129757749 [Uranotaenia lowii]|uniref:uncharacterized protein LOC129757749 n=1 Tax=Uranotaenia lowii TaxID=190385 RepID=UPI00247919E4|nr:uncharacterized protein LOC129757749 [Uranotaenia lowii]XP_055611018.1 uncharacterized protein LOC129757749 [Uranotaenia lowii]XP_055611019.1 uncharacterized protein LOC129757749 [Uranotaenia lowii]
MLDYVFQSVASGASNITEKYSLNNRPYILSRNVVQVELEVGTVDGIDGSELYRSNSATVTALTIDKNISSEPTSLNAKNQLKGEVLQSSEPEIQGFKEFQTVIFCESLPTNTPPTYRGVMVKYCYKITATTQRAVSTVQALHAPLRVLQLPPINYSDETITLNDLTNEELAPRNFFLGKKSSIKN